MKTGAMICGIIGGLLGIVIGTFGAGVGALASAAGNSSGELLQFISLAIPIASIAGGALTRANGILAALLMAASAIGMVSVFGVNVFTSIPLALSAIGALLAYLSVTKNMTQQ